MADEVQDQPYLNPEARVEVVWRLAGQKRWRSAVNGPREVVLMPHDLLCGLDHGVRADGGFREGTKAEFGFRLPGEDEVYVLTAESVRVVFERYYLGQGADRCRAVLNRVLRVMGAPLVERIAVPA